MASAFQLHVLPLSWPDLELPYTLPKVWRGLARTDLSEALFVFEEDDLRAYDGDHQEMWLAEATVLRLARTRMDNILRAAVGRAGAAAIRFPVIHALGEPLAFLMIRPALGHSSAPNMQCLAEQRELIADSVLASWLAKQGLLGSIPDNIRPRDPWFRRA
jgi:hypothetical protein